MVTEGRQSLDWSTLPARPAGCSAAQTMVSRFEEGCGFQGQLPAAAPSEGYREACSLMCWIRLDAQFGVGSADRSATRLGRTNATSEKPQRVLFWIQDVRSGSKEGGQARAKRSVSTPGRILQRGYRERVASDGTEKRFVIVGRTEGLERGIRTPRDGDRGCRRLGRRRKSQDSQGDRESRQWVG